MQIVGSVSKDGSKKNGDIEYFSSQKSPIDTTHKDGRYKVLFYKDFIKPPVVIASGDGGSAGCFIEVVEVTKGYFIAESRDYGNHGLNDSGFNFIAIL